MSSGIRHFSLVAFTLIFLSACGGGGGETTPAYFQFSSAGMVQALSSSGGGYLAGVSSFGDRFSYPIPPGVDTNSLPPIEIPNGNWSFLAVVWDGPEAMEGDPNCAEVNVPLDQENQTVSLTLSRSACGSPTFGPGSDINHLHLVACNNLAGINSEADTCYYGEKMPGESSSFEVVLLGGANFPVLKGDGSLAQLKDNGFGSKCISDNPIGQPIGNNLYSNYITDIRIPVMPIHGAFPVAIVAYEDPFCNESDVMYYYKAGLGNGGDDPQNAQAKIFPDKLNGGLGITENFVYIPDNYIGLAANPMVGHSPFMICPAETGLGHCLPYASYVSNYNLFGYVSNQVQRIIGPSDGLDFYAKPRAAETNITSVGGGTGNFRLLALDPLGQGGNGIVANFIDDATDPPVAAYDTGSRTLTVNYDSTNSTVQEMRDIIDLDANLPFVTDCSNTAANDCDSNQSNTNLASNSPLTFNGGSDPYDSRRELGLLGWTSETFGGGFFSFLKKHYGFNSCADIPLGPSTFAATFITDFGPLGAGYTAGMAAGEIFDSEIITVRFEAPTKTVPVHFATASTETYEKRVVFTFNDGLDQEFTAVEFFCDPAKRKVGYFKSYDANNEGGAREHEVEFFYDMQDQATAQAELYMVSESVFGGATNRSQIYTYLKKSSVNAYDVHSVEIYTPDITAPNDHASNDYQRFAANVDMSLGSFGKIKYVGYIDNSSLDVFTTFASSGASELVMEIDPAVTDCVDGYGFPETSCGAIVDDPPISTPALGGGVDFDATSVKDKILLSGQAGSILTPFSF